MLSLKLIQFSYPSSPIAFFAVPVSIGRKQYVPTEEQIKNKEKRKAYLTRYKARQEEIRAREKQEKIRKAISSMTSSIRTRTYLAFRNKGFKKSSSTGKLIGCSWKYLIKHIEKQFVDGMSWDNRSEWHIDHIIPISCATTIKGLEKLSHYSNLRPLWAAQNLAKSNRLVLIQ